MPATRSRASHAGIRPATCATSSKPFASPRREEKSHDRSACSYLSARSLGARGFKSRCDKCGAPHLHASERNRGLQVGTESRGGAEQLHRVSLRRLRQHSTARAEIQKGFLAGRSDENDQGLRRPDRRGGHRKDRRLPDRGVLNPTWSRPRIRVRAPNETRRCRAAKIGTVEIFRFLSWLSHCKSCKIRQLLAISTILCRISMSFKLSSLLHTAYPAFLGHAGLRGWQF